MSCRFQLVYRQYRAMNHSVQIDQLTRNTEQVVLPPAIETRQDGLVSGFFAIGMVINLVLVIAYFIWAFKQWGKK